jgi:hypothetical protein
MLLAGIPAISIMSYLGSGLSALYVARNVVLTGAAVSLSYYLVENASSFFRQEESAIPSQNDKKPLVYNGRCSNRVLQKNPQKCLI